jgi:hypothetical protein
LHATHSELQLLTKKIDAAMAKHNDFLKELELPLLP